MKEPKPKTRKVAIRARMKPSVKAMAEQLAQKDARSLADWLERLIAAEAARRRRKSRMASGQHPQRVVWPSQKSEDQNSANKFTAVRCEKQDRSPDGRGP